MDILAREIVMHEQFGRIPEYCINFLCSPYHRYSSVVPDNPSLLYQASPLDIRLVYLFPNINSLGVFSEKA